MVTELSTNNMFQRNNSNEKRKKMFVWVKKCTKGSDIPPTFSPTFSFRVRLESIDNVKTTTVRLL